MPFFIHALRELPFGGGGRPALRVFAAVALLLAGVELLSVMAMRVDPAVPLRSA